MEGHANALSEQTNRFSSPSARGTESFLDRRKPPRKCRLKECSPGETWYTLISLGEMAPTFEPSRKTVTAPPSPITGLRRWPRPRLSRDAARAKTRVGNAGQIRFGARHSWMLAPTSSSVSGDASPSRVAATTSDLSRSWFMVVLPSFGYKQVVFGQMPARPFAGEHPVLTAPVHLRHEVTSHLSLAGVDEGQREGHIVE